MRGIEIKHVGARLRKRAHPQFVRSSRYAHLDQPQKEGVSAGTNKQPCTEPA